MPIRGLRHEEELGWPDSKGGAPVCTRSDYQSSALVAAAMRVGARSIPTAAPELPGLLSQDRRRQEFVGERPSFRIVALSSIDSTTEEERLAENEFREHPELTERANCSQRHVADEPPREEGLGCEAMLSRIFNRRAGRQR